MSPARLLALGLLVVVASITLPEVGSARSFDEDDVETERCLAQGKIVRKKRTTLEGVTAPELITLECAGVERHAVIKRLHESTRGVTRFDDGTWEVNFTDSYRYERAAYLLDRALGLNMVPVAVIRRDVRGMAAFVEWIDHAAYERDSPHRPSGPELAELARQKALMRVFDALIYNTDRNTQNWLVDDADWRLYLIDHSRAFRETSDLPPWFLEAPARLSRELYERLRELDEAILSEMLEDVVSPLQIRAVLARRDKILEKIDGDRRELGDEVVFSG